MKKIRLMRSVLLLFACVSPSAPKVKMIGEGVRQPPQPGYGAVGMVGGPSGLPQVDATP